VHARAHTRTHTLSLSPSLPTSLPLSLSLSLARARAHTHTGLVQKVGAVIVTDQHSLAEAVAAIDYKECGKRILVREVHTCRIFNIFFWASLGQFYKRGHCVPSP
jgi:hypothetical protein